MARAQIVYENKNDNEKTVNQVLAAEQAKAAQNKAENEKTLDEIQEEGIDT